MNVKELRIGNWFNEMCTDQIIKVEQLEKNGTIHFSGEFIGYWQAEPLQINEKILLDFGFQVLPEKYTRNYILTGKIFHKNVDFICYGDIFITSNVAGFALCIALIDDGVESFITIKGIKYVHQLQNLYFALTGEEL
jgi:hypothetical protein